VGSKMLACNLIQAREKKFRLPLPKSLKLNPRQPESDVQEINRGGVGAVDLRSCEKKTCQSQCRALWSTMETTYLFLAIG
jgi:hypothetical protein